MGRQQINKVENQYFRLSPAVTNSRPFFLLFSFVVKPLGSKQRTNKISLHLNDLQFLKISIVKVYLDKLMNKNYVISKLTLKLH